MANKIVIATPYRQKEAYIKIYGRLKIKYESDYQGGEYKPSFHLFWLPRLRIIRDEELRNETIREFASMGYEIMMFL
jgi:hypothetical protein